MKKWILTGLLFLASLSSLQAAEPTGIAVPSCSLTYRVAAYPFDSLLATKGVLEFGCVPTLIKFKQCVLRADAISKHLKKVSDHFSRNLEVTRVGQGTMWQRYLSLKDGTIQQQERIGHLIKEFTDIPTDESAILKQMSNLQTRFSAEIKAINEIYMQESQILWAIDQLQADLDSFGISGGVPIAADDGSACLQKELASSIEKIGTLNLQMTKEPDQIKQAILKNRKSREAILQYAFTYFNLALETAYRNAIIGKLSDLGGKLEAVLQAKSVGAQFEAWVTYTSIEEERNYSESVYLQYTRPLTLALQDQKTATDFLERMQIISDSYPEVAAPYVSRMQSVIGFLGDKVNRITTKGWQGYFTSQKAWADRYKSNPARVSQQCVSLMDDYLKTYSDVQTIDQYQAAEDSYKKAAIVCRGK